MMMNILFIWYEIEENWTPRNNHLSHYEFGNVWEWKWLKIDDDEEDGAIYEFGIIEYLLTNTYYARII